MTTFSYAGSGMTEAFFPFSLALWFWSSFFFSLHTAYQVFWERKRMPGRVALALSALCASFVYGQTASADGAGTTLVTISPTSGSGADATTSYRAIFTIPSDVDNSVPLIPNIYDSQAVNPQDVCPGYTASNVLRTPYGLTALLTLAGEACNVYGTDIDALNLTVEYQSDDRLHIEITPTYVGPSNNSWHVSRFFFFFFLSSTLALIGNIGSDIIVSMSCDISH